MVMVERQKQNIDIINAIDADRCYEDFKASDYSVDWLASFIKQCPIAFHISWVKDQIAGFCQWGDLDSINKLLRGRGKRREPSEQLIFKNFIDYKIFKSVSALLRQGLTLTGEDGCLEKLATSGIRVNGKRLPIGNSKRNLEKRYYRYRDHKPQQIMDHGTLICGPTAIEIGIDDKKITYIGIWEIKMPPNLRKIK